MSLYNLAEMSNRYGGNEEFVLGGGGNTSFKENGVMYVKGSGAQLSNIQKEQFVSMDINKLLEMVKREYPKGMSDSEREEKSLAEMMAARLPGEEAKRPSIESVLHAMFPYKFVLHVHPPLINGLTCGVNGKTACYELFGDKAVWIDLTKPGFVLAQKCSKVFTEYAEKTGSYPQLVLLQNHGIFIAADTVDEIDRLMESVVEKLKKHVSDVPCFDDTGYDKALADSISSKLSKLYSSEKDDSAVVIFCANKQVSNYVSSKEAFRPVSKAFTPDHIVNCKDEPLFIEPDASIEIEFVNYKTKKGFDPKIVAVMGLGFFAISENQKNAERAKALFLDSIKIAIYAKSFGGENHLSDEFADFILNWEVEAYRSKA